MSKVATRMSKVATMIIASALAIGASSFAGAQTTSRQTGNPDQNAAASGGPGTHAGAMRSGSSSNTQKVYKNQNGYQPGRE